MILSRNLGLDLASMQNEAVPVGLRNLGPCKFKKASTTSEKELALARTLATRVVELITPAGPWDFPCCTFLPSLQVLRRWRG